MKGPGKDAPVVAIIDDEEDIATYLRVALEDEGFRVVSTSDAGEAMDLLVGSRPDLICLDLLMPEQTGVSLYADLMDNRGLRDIPVIFLSGLTNRQGLPEMLDEAGGLPAPAAFLEKPVDVDELIDTVKRILAGSAEART